MVNAYAQGSQIAPQVSPLINLMPVIFIFFIFYFLLIKPQRKQQDEHKKMLSSLSKNDEIITSGGIHGTIVNVKDDAVSLRIDDNVKIEVQKSAISVLKKKRE